MRFLALPPSLLLLVAASPWIDVAAGSSSHGSRDVLGSLTHANLLDKRRLDPELVVRGDAIKSPIAVRKMSDDAGEKFYPEYWRFDVDTSRLTPNTLRPPPTVAEFREIANTSASIELFPPFLSHTDISQPQSRNLARNIFQKRAYKCPSGTDSCSAIGYPYSCCGTTETCVTITDTGLGRVGCCPEGAECSGTVGNCDTAAGYTSCPNSSNGGCCIPGYTCDSIGCVAGSTQTLTTTASTLVVAGASSIVVSTITTAATNTVTTSTVFETEVITLITSSSASIQTIYITRTTPTSTTTVGLSTALTTIYTTITEAGPAVRPTSGSDSTGTVTITSKLPDSTTTVGSGTLQTVSDYCPTGFYQCSAYYGGGCCQVGRDCASISCPALASTTILTGNVVTIIVATGAGVTTVTQSGGALTTTTASPTAVVGVTTVQSSSTSPSTTILNNGAATCAAGWYDCAASDGGGCCPSGYSCAASCIATQTGEPSHVYKVAANHAVPVSMSGSGKWLVGLAGMVGVGMMWL